MTAGLGLSVLCSFNSVFTWICHTWGPQEQHHFITCYPVERPTSKGPTSISTLVSYLTVSSSFDLCFTSAFSSLFFFPISCVFFSWLEFCTRERMTDICIHHAGSEPKQYSKCTVNFGLFRGDNSTTSLVALIHLICIVLQTPYWF